MAWHFRQLVRGYLWTNGSRFGWMNCRLILWRGQAGTWAAAATLQRHSEQVRETFDSHESQAAGLDLCLDWLSGFIASHRLPPLALLEAWERLPT